MTSHQEATHHSESAPRYTSSTPPRHIRRAKRRTGVYRDCTGALSQISETSFSSDPQAKKGVDLDRQADGLAGRNARALAHDVAAIRAQGNNSRMRLRTSPLFSGLPFAAELELCASSMERPFPNRKIIFRDDDPIRFVDVVARGSVKITQVTPEGERLFCALTGPAIPSTEWATPRRGCTRLQRQRFAIVRY